MFLQRIRHFGNSDQNILLLFLLGGLLTSIWSEAIHSAGTRFGLSGGWWEGWLQNFSTELFGAFFTFWLLGMIVEDRRKRDAQREAGAEAEREREQNQAALEAMREAVTKAVTDEMRRIQQVNAIARLQAGEG